ncbi:MAG TPA: hypothetical protein VGL71_02880 [Urbifossiella sp.]|jgi:hypothetical protein
MIAWDDIEAMEHLRAVQRASEAKRINPDEPRIESLKSAVVRSMVGKDLAAVRDNCGVLLTAIANLPVGKYIWR